LFFGPGQLVIGAAGSKATRAAFTVRDFDAVHQGVAIFDLLGMIAGTERTCGLLPPDEVHTSDGTAGRLTTDRLTSATKGARLGDTAPVRRIEVFLPSWQKDHELCIRFAYVKALATST